MKRSRRWIEQTLWSDRAPDQARGSLRQTLFELRQQLGQFSRAIQSDRVSIWLDSNLVQVVPCEIGREFLEGIDVQDPKFKDWLSRKRFPNSQERSDLDDATKMVRIQCGLPWTAETNDAVGERIFNDNVGGIITGFIANSSRGVLDTDADLVVRASTDEGADGAVVSVQVVDARRDVLIHSDHSVHRNLATLLTDESEMSKFCWKVADGALDQLAKSHRQTSPVAMRAAWSQEAIGAILTFDQSIMPRSLDILDEAAGILPDGLFFALRAWSIMSLVMEGRIEETQETLSAVRGALERARSLAPGDPMVNGIVANVHSVLFEDYEKAFRLSSMALKGQPNNIFAAQAMSLCRFQLGSQEAAYLLSRRNRDIAEFTKYGPMCNLHHALLCLRTRRAAEAIAASRAASDAVPAYRAPSRQLVALYAAGGQVDEAMAQSAKLSEIEPGHSIDRLLNDESYPVNTLRASGVLDQAKQALGKTDDL